MSASSYPNEPAVASVAWLRPALYGALNISAATAIVFANKAVLSIYGFEFTTALTLLHTLTTIAGMTLFSQLGLFMPKTVPKMQVSAHAHIMVLLEVKAAKVCQLTSLSVNWLVCNLQVLPLAAAYVGYVVLNNLSLKLNTVGFYQISKICIMPTLIVIEIVMFGKWPSRRVLAAVLLVCLGVALATVTDKGISTNVIGLAVGLAAVLVTAMYQVWAGSKQKELQTSSMQLLHQYTPIAALMLAILVPVMEPVGLFEVEPERPTLLGYKYSAVSITAIAISSVLGLLVSLSTFLVIGATSSLTYNIVGHLKTVTILTGGCLIFGDSMTVTKFLGISVAMAGIGWYSQMQLSGLQQPKVSKPNTPDAETGHAHVLSLR